jgi:hypothetical protein
MNPMKKIFLVIPTIRDLSFLNSWGNEFSQCHLIIVEDSPIKKVKLPQVDFASIVHYTWKHIQSDFGQNEWIFSRRNAGIRSYGFYKAWQLQADMVVTLDDDCYPSSKKSNFLQTHIQNLTLHCPQSWTATYPNPNWNYTRGFPYTVRNAYPVKISHGIWSGALDLDAKTEIRLPHLLDEKPYPPYRQFIPHGHYYPMCSMNLAFQRDVIPLMFFPMMGQNHHGHPWPYDRFDDIWAGILSKKIMDHLGWGVVSGSPQVQHIKKSITKMNVIKEKTGIKENETFWKSVDEVILTKKHPIDAYIELALKLPDRNKIYMKKLKQAMITWANAYSK